MAGFAGLRSGEWWTGTGRPTAAAVGTAHRAIRLSPAVFRNHSLPEYDSIGKQPPFPGSQELERRIKSLVRWNALAMVMRANKRQEGIGGHISTYASAATLYEVAFNHFFRAQTPDGDRDLVYLPGTRGAGNLCARISGRPDFGEAAGEFPPRTGRRRWAELLSASVADAGFLGVSDGFDGTGADPGDLPGALQSLSGESRAEASATRARSGPFWETARRTSRSRWARSRWLRGRSSTT